MTVHDRTRLNGQLQLIQKQYAGVSQVLMPTRDTPAVVLSRTDLNVATATAFILDPAL